MVAYGTLMDFPTVSPSMLPWITAAQSAALDQAAVSAGLPVEILMEIAGWQVAVAARALYPHARRIRILAGFGNNGGDGLVAARYLAAWGLDVRVSLHGRPGSKLGPLTGAQHVRALAYGVQDADRSDGLGTADLVLDALVGTGSRLPLAPPLAELCDAMPRSGAPVLAVDCPSGLDATTGAADGMATRASATVCLCAPKTGLAKAPDIVGDLLVADLPMPLPAWQALPAISPSPLLRGGIVRIARENADTRVES